MAKARNDVMHSGDSSFSDSDLATLFRRMIVTLSIYSDKLKYCNKAIDILADVSISLPWYRVVLYDISI
jgi:hypothetical protein